MSKVNRRGLLKTAAIAVVSVVSTENVMHASPRIVSKKSQGADVSQVRSFDSNVFLTITDILKGWAQLDPLAHGIAAACQMTGKKVQMTYTKFNPNGLNGTGVFEGVKLACQVFEIS